MSEQELAQLRVCGAADCGYQVPNGVKDIDHILKALNNHILATHPVNQKPTEGWSAKLTATLPMLEKSISETAYQTI